MTYCEDVSRGPQCSICKNARIAERELASTTEVQEESFGGTICQIDFAVPSFTPADYRSTTTEGISNNRLATNYKTVHSWPSDALVNIPFMILWLLFHLFLGNFGKLIH